MELKLQFFYSAIYLIANFFVLRVKGKERRRQLCKKLQKSRQPTFAKKNFFETDEPSKKNDEVPQLRESRTKEKF